jgi:hypothetical protein
MPGTDEQHSPATQPGQRGVENRSLKSELPSSTYLPHEHMAPASRRVDGPGRRVKRPWPLTHCIGYGSRSDWSVAAGHSLCCRFLMPATAVSPFAKRAILPQRPWQRRHQSQLPPTVSRCAMRKKTVHSTSRLTLARKSRLPTATNLLARKHLSKPHGTPLTTGMIEAQQADGRVAKLLTTIAAIAYQTNLRSAG